MFPILFSIGPFKLYTIALFLCIGFFFGLFVIWKRGKELHYEERELFDTVFMIMLWMFVGARLSYVLLHFFDYYPHVLSVLDVIQRPGWYFPGGVLLGLVMTLRMARQMKWDGYQVTDLFVTGLVLSQAIMALGSFFGGVGVGMPTTSFLGVKFDGMYDRRYPVQLWEMVGYSLCFAYLWWVEGVYRTFSWYKRNRSQAETGFLTALYLIWWGMIVVISALFRTPEFVVSFVRFDVVIPLFFGVFGGLLLLLSRSGFSMKDFWNGFLTYFGFRSPMSKW